MTTRRSAKHPIRAALAAAAAAFCVPGLAEEGGLERFAGRWEVRVNTLQPERKSVIYPEVYEWVLGRRFLRGYSERPEEGTEEVIYATYDARIRGYPFWIFSSTGTYTYLPPASWNPATRTMAWDSPREWDIVYKGRCVFPDDDTRHCELIVKDWKGKVLLEQESSAVRQGG
jgi:hypothetical protein